MSSVMLLLVILVLASRSTAVSSSRASSSVNPFKSLKKSREWGHRYHQSRIAFCTSSIHRTRRRDFKRRRRKNLVGGVKASESNSYDPEDYDNEWGDNGDNIVFDRQQFVQRQRQILISDGRQQRQAQQEHISFENEDDDEHIESSHYNAMNDSVATLGEEVQQMLKSQKKDQSNIDKNNRNDESSNGLLNPQISQSSSSTPLPQAQHQQRITTEQINSIKSSISLVDVIESYNLPQFTRSTNSAATAKACCPFHNDNNPSLYIDDNRQLYKCFACGAGGDVFNFVREHDYLLSSSTTTTTTAKIKEKMGYMQAVEYVVQEYSNNNDIIDLGSIWKYKNRISTNNMTTNNDNEATKRRIQQANTAAVAYYIKCLITLPMAGKARSHLRSIRQLVPETIQTFAIGYAPDVYYGDEATTTTPNTWGAGSLVEYLSKQGFTPSEIVQSGLAVRIKKQTRMTTSDDVVNEDVINEKNTMIGSNDQHQNNVDDGYDYSDLMDRFRSRLIIPIMDDSGQFVIALGGRYLETAAERSNSESSSTFKPAKYINSPDSPVFTKKNVLFNKARAKLALDESKRISSESTSSSPLTAIPTFAASPAIVLVEGYFDAISLSNVGIQNVVASMGTALPIEQLKLLAEMRNSGPPGEKIILCMDNDDAGRNAVERVCSSNILSKVPELSKNELYIATLTSSADGGNDNEVKDPSDFVNFVGGGIQAGIRFQEEVLNNAIPWDEWYVDRLLSKPTVESSSSDDGMNFASICNDISTFLATFSNPAERTQRVHKIGDKLVKLIANDDASSSSLGMLRAQLESDILNMSSRKAGVREAIERRIEHTDGVSGEATISRMKRLSSGNVGTIDDDDGRKMSSNTIAKLMPPRKDYISRRQRSVPPSTYSARARKEVTRTRGYNTNQKQRNRLRADDMQSEERHIVSHFNGFEFKHQSDKDWLGLASGYGAMKSKMYLGGAPGSGDEKERLRAETSMFEDSAKPSRKKDDVLYFNSNRYLGKQYLLPLAIRAGYELGDERPSPGETLVEFTDRKLFQSPDPDQQIMQAESRLLHALAKFPQARMAMRSVYSTSTFGPSNLFWTSEERKWLFLCLTGSSQIDPPLPTELLDRGNQYQLQLYLTNRGDCPVGSFSRNVISTSKPVNDERFASSVEAIDTVIETPVNRSVTDILMDESEEVPFTRLEVEVLASENNELDSILNVPSQVNDQKSNSSDDNSSGLLDEYFLQTDMFPSFGNNKITKEARAALTVQETISTLLRASAMKRFVSAKKKITKIVHEMDYRSDDDDDMHQKKLHDFDNVSSEELQTLFEKVGNEVIEAQRSLYDSDRSTDRVNSHLLDYSVTNGVKYKLSQSELERLDDMMEEHIASLQESDHRPTTSGDDGSYVFGEDEFDEKINSVYGGRNPEDYVVRGLSNGENAWD